MSARKDSIPQFLSVQGGALVPPGPLPEESDCLITRFDHYGSTDSMSLDAAFNEAREADYNQAPYQSHWNEY